MIHEQLGHCPFCGRRCQVATGESPDASVPVWIAWECDCGPKPSGQAARVVKVDRTKRVVEVTAEPKGRIAAPAGPKWRE